jgi:hypothetical protein
VNPCQQGGLAALRRGHWHEVAAGERSIPARRKERAELPSAITWWSRLDRARRPLSGATRSWESRCVRPLFCTRRRTCRAGACRKRPSRRPAANQRAGSGACTPDRVNLSGTLTLKHRFSRETSWPVLPCPSMPPPRRPPRADRRRRAGAVAGDGCARAVGV